MLGLGLLTPSKELEGPILSNERGQQEMDFFKCSNDGLVSYKHPAFHFKGC